MKTLQLLSSTKPCLSFQLASVNLFPLDQDAAINSREVVCKLELNWKCTVRGVAAVS